jgi:hypothetical protein
MREDYELQLEAARAWAGEALAAGWLTASAVASLNALEQRSPAGLFEPGAHRPLAAAFFGGTGAGKSSLLNRLAGGAVARVGVERPTSREVSIYLHESLHLRQLPKEFPVDRVRVSRHEDERRRQVLWIDMPDIDSIEAGNRDLALAWLPHIDALIYVVNPERYRDDKGWRMLRAYAGEHAWLFVMNHWDRGQPAQLEDFAQLLRRGGFDDPLIFRTDCRDEASRRKPDDFAALEETIESLSDRHLMKQLESRVLDGRRDELRAALSACLDALGDPEDLVRLRARWADIWREYSLSLTKGLEWPLREIAGSFVGRDANPLGKPVKLDQPPPAPLSPSLLWDDWARMQWRDALDRLLMAADETGLPAPPLQRRLEEIERAADGVLLAETQSALRKALANPGNAAQRFLLKLTGLCAILLPLVAVGWVSWQAVASYYQSVLLHAGFLGADFAIHSGVIVAVAWLLPFFLNRGLKPSAARAAEKGLRAGVASGLALLGEKIDDALNRYAQDQRDRRQDGENLLAQFRPAAAKNPGGILGRVLANGKPEEEP